MTRASRFLVLTPGILGRDGVSELARQLTGALAEIRAARDVEVWSLAGDGVRRELPGGAHLRCADGRRARLASWAIGQSVRRQTDRSVVVLHAHLAPLALPFVMRGSRYFQLLIGIEAWEPLSPLRRAALARADRLVSISEHTASEFKRHNADFAGVPTPVCLPGLPLAAGGSGAEPAPSKSYALIVARMASVERYKGHDALIDLWPSVLARVPDARLLVVGGGDDRSRLEQRAKTLRVAGNVVFEGELSEAALMERYRECAFFVMPSPKEGFGLAFLEAMRCGKPCIGASGAASEIIEPGRSGFIVDPSDPHSLSAAIVRLFEDEPLRAAMGSRARERFRSLFTSEHFRVRLERCFDLGADLEAGHAPSGTGELELRGNTEPARNVE